MKSVINSRTNFQTNNFTQLFHLNTFLKNKKAKNLNANNKFHLVTTPTAIKPATESQLQHKEHCNKLVQLNKVLPTPFKENTHIPVLMDNNTPFTIPLMKMASTQVRFLPIPIFSYLKCCIVKLILNFDFSRGCPFASCPSRLNSFQRYKQPKDLG